MTRRTSLRSALRLAVVPAVLVASTSCGGSAGQEAVDGPDPASPSSTVADPSPTVPTPTTADTPPKDADPLPPVTDAVSLPALMRADLGAARLRSRTQVPAGDAYSRQSVTYSSGKLKVSGVLLRPPGKGPFPAVVLNHGYIEPSIYRSGQGLSREQDYLARAGFVVLHTDYRGHAGSDPASGRSRLTRLGYTRDTINAVRALKKQPYVDAERVAMLGRSMGGAVTLNALVVRPGLVRAAVLFAPVSSDFLDNFNRWTVAERPAEAEATYRRHGTPAQSPAFYRNLSARTFFDRVTEPVLIHHGTDDDTCPIGWSRTTQRLLARAGVDSRLEIYAGEQHAFGPQWPRSMERTVRFLRRHLGA